MKKTRLDKIFLIISSIYFFMGVYCLAICLFGGFATSLLIKGIVLTLVGGFCCYVFNNIKITLTKIQDKENDDDE